VLKTTKKQFCIKLYTIVETVTNLLLLISILHLLSLLHIKMYKFYSHNPTLVWLCYGSTSSCLSVSVTSQGSYFHQHGGRDTAVCKTPLDNKLESTYI